MNLSDSVSTTSTNDLSPSALWANRIDSFLRELLVASPALRDAILFEALWRYNNVSDSDFTSWWTEVGVDETGGVGWTTLDRTSKPRVHSDDIIVEVVWSWKLEKTLRRFTAIWAQAFVELREVCRSSELVPEFNRFVTRLVGDALVLAPIELGRIARAQYLPMRLEGDERPGVLYELTGAARAGSESVHQTPFEWLVSYFTERVDERARLFQTHARQRVVTVAPSVPTPDLLQRAENIAAIMQATGITYRELKEALEADARKKSVVDNSNIAPQAGNIPLSDWTPGTQVDQYGNPISLPNPPLTYYDQFANPIVMSVTWYHALVALVLAWLLLAVYAFMLVHMRDIAGLIGEVCLTMFRIVMYIPLRILDLILYPIRAIRRSKESTPDEIDAPVSGVSEKFLPATRTVESEQSEVACLIEAAQTRYEELKQARADGLVKAPKPIRPVPMEIIPEMALPGAKAFPCDAPTCCLCIIYSDGETAPKVVGMCSNVKIVTKSKATHLRIITSGHVFKDHGISAPGFSWGRKIDGKWQSLPFASVNTVLSSKSLDSDVMTLKTHASLYTGLKLQAVVVRTPNLQKVAYIYAWHADGFHRSEGHLSVYPAHINALKYDGYTDYGYSGAGVFQRFGTTLALVAVHYGRHEKGGFNICQNVGYFSQPKMVASVPVSSPPGSRPETPWSEDASWEYERGYYDRDLDDYSISRSDSYDDERGLYHIGDASHDDEEALAHEMRKIAAIEARERHGAIDTGALRGGVLDDSDAEGETQPPVKPAPTTHPAQLFQLGPQQGGDSFKPVTLSTSSATMQVETEEIFVAKPVLSGLGPKLSPQTALASRWSDLPAPSDLSPPVGERPPQSAEYAALLKQNAEMKAQLAQEKKQANIVEAEVARRLKAEKKAANIAAAEAAKAAGAAKKKQQAARNPVPMTEPKSKVKYQEQLALVIAQAVGTEFRSALKESQQSSSTTADQTGQPKPNT